MKNMRAFKSLADWWRQQPGQPVLGSVRNYQHHLAVSPLSVTDFWHFFNNKMSLG